jgi:hypothetical protein
MKKIALTISMLFITTNVFGEWESYGSVKGNEIFYDRSTIKKMGVVLSVWAYYNINQNATSLLGLKQIDCLNETIKTLTIKEYTKLNLKGEILYDSTPDNPQVDYIIPSSSDAALMKLVCKK